MATLRPNSGEFKKTNNKKQPALYIMDDMGSKTASLSGLKGALSDQSTVQIIH